MKTKICKQKDIIDLIELYGGNLVWWKYNKSHNIYSRVYKPPYIVFRFDRDNAKFINQLKSIVDSYSGKMKWTILGTERTRLKGVNWMLSASKIQGVEGQVDEYNQIDVQKIEYEDLLGIYEYIKTSLTT